MSRWSDIWDSRKKNNEFRLRRSPLIVGFILGGFTIWTIMFTVDMIGWLLFR